MIDALSNGDRSKWDYFFGMNVVELLNTMAFRKDKAEHELQLQQKALNQSR